MFVRINHGPQFGHTRHIERNQTTQLLLDLGLIEIVKAPAPAPAPTTPRFWVAPSAHTGNLGIHVQKPSGETLSVYVAASKAAAEAALGASEMPQSVWDTYAAKTNADKDKDWLADQAAKQVVKNRW